MRLDTKARLLIPITGVEVEFPVIPTEEDKKIYVGAFQGKGVYIASETVAVFYRDSGVEDDLNGEVKVDRRRKVTFKNGVFYLGKQEIKVEITDASYTVKNYMEGYIESDGDALDSDVLYSLLKRGYVVDRPYLGFVRQHQNGKFSVMKTFAENYDNGILKIEDGKCVILIAIDSVPEEYVFDPAFYDALAIVGSKPFRVGFDSHGRFVFFTTDTAVIMPSLANKSFAGMCTETSFSKGDADCGLVVSEKLDNVMTLCRKHCLKFTEKMDSLLNKKTTSTPIVNELSSGTCKWKKAKEQKNFNIAGVGLKLVAECRGLKGYENKRVKVIGR